MNTAKQLEYYSYINSSNWKYVRQMALNHYGNKCFKCNSIKELHVHHKTYKNFMHEELEDLVVLCKECHFDIHNRRSALIEKCKVKRIRKKKDKKQAKSKIKIDEIVKSQIERSKNNINKKIVICNNNTERLMTEKQELARERTLLHSCKACGLPTEENIYEWKEMKSGGMGIKGSCGSCGKYIGYMPMNALYRSLAK